MFTNLLKATIATALLPITAAADIVMMPIDAVNDDEFASRTKAMAGSVSNNIKAALDCGEGNGGLSDEGN